MDDKVKQKAIVFCFLYYVINFANYIIVILVYSFINLKLLKLNL